MVVVRSLWMRVSLIVAGTLKAQLEADELFVRVTVDGTLAEYELFKDTVRTQFVEGPAPVTLL